MKIKESTKFKEFVAFVTEAEDLYHWKWSSENHQKLAMKFRKELEDQKIETQVYFEAAREARGL
jgi:hypothetical protein